MHKLGWLNIISSDQGTHFTTHSFQQWSERYTPLRNNLIENWNDQLKHWLSKCVGGRQRHEELVYMLSQVCAQTKHEHE